MNRKFFSAFTLLAIIFSNFLFADTPLKFIPNKGQVADTKGNLRKDILFDAISVNAKIYLREKGISYVIAKADAKEKDEKKENEPDKRNVTFCRMDVDFINSLLPSAETSSPADDFLNFYYSHCPNGITNVKQFQKVIYKNIYSNIDISFSGNYSSGLKYDFIVNPGGNAVEILLRYSCAEKIELENGKLKIKTPLGDVNEFIPSIYQEINGEKIKVKGGYKIISAENGETIIGFEISSYNKSFPLIIDPWWSTYVGGNLGDIIYGTAFDNAGNLFVSGATESGNFPATAGVFQTSLAGGLDAFASKFSPNGNLIWSTFYGGTSEDDAHGIAVDANGFTYIDGISSSINFPTSAGAFQTVNNATGFASFNAFLFRLDPTGSRIFGTYYGGNGTTWSFGVTVDGNNNAIMVGYTSSSNLPVSAGAFQSANAGVYEAFCTEFTPAGAQFWGTYMGGSADDRAYGVAADNANNIYVAGNSTSGNFPVSAGCFQSTNGGGGAYGDAFVFKFDNSGSRLWATYLGGSSDDAAHGIAVDGNNDIVFTGVSLSPNFPVTAGAYQTTNTMITLTPVARADFLTKMNSAGNMVWSTYYNVATEEGAMSIDVDQFNQIYIVDDMETSSTTPLVPANTMGCAFDTSFNNTPFPQGDPEDQFITKFNSSGFPVCETFIGGPTEDEHELWTKYMSVKNCRMTVAGSTDGGFPVSPGAFQTVAPNNMETGFLINLSTFQCGDTAHSSGFSDSVKSTNCSATVNFYAHVCNPADTMGISYVWNFPSGNPASATGAVVTGVNYISSGTYPVTLFVKACGTTVDSVTQTISVTASSFSTAVSSVNAVCNTTGQATATPSGGNPPYTYLWSSGASSQTASGLTAGNYSVLITDATGCTSTATVAITNSNAPPVINISSDVTISSGQSVSLNATGGGTYQWSNGASTSSIIVSPTQTTVYCVTVADTNGCSDSACVKVFVELICDEWYLPNAFSPNGDNENETFGLYISNYDCVKDFKLIIYNRWGEKVFETQSPQAVWDGTYKNTKEGSAVFAWYVKVTLVNGNEMERKGNVSVLR